MSNRDEVMVVLALHHAGEFGEWPKLEWIHRKLHQEIGLSFDVQEAARRMEPQPYVGGGYSHLRETFAPSPRVIGRVEEGRHVLDAVVAWLNLARAKYLSSQGQPTITSAEFMNDIGVDESTARALRVVLGWIPSSTDGSHWNDDGWTITVADDIVSWPHLTGINHLLAELDKRYMKQDDLGAVADDSKYRLLEATGRVATPETSNSSRVRWMQKPAPQIAAWLATVAGGIAAAIFIWTWIS